MHDLSVKQASTMEFHWGVRIALRDGVFLSATLYLPGEQLSPAPCILTLTPYVSDTYHERGKYFATHGLPFVIVDVRGRGNSEGEFRPFIQEAQDGYDAVEWLARQPFCNGKVAMWGGSYAGYAQWATVKEFPPHLATIVPAAATFLGVDSPIRNNIFSPYLVQWLTFTSGRTSQTAIFSDGAFWSAIYRQWHESGRSLRDLDGMLGNSLPVFQEWLSHPEPDAHWDAYNPTAAQYARLHIPILTITGIYDDEQPGALAHYKEHLANAAPIANPPHYLIMGPWDHAGTRAPKLEFGGVECGAASLLDLPKLHLEWYAWTMQDGHRPEFLKKLVAYYVMGTERWRYADSLEAITMRHEAYFLDSGGNATDVFFSGSLGNDPGRGPPDVYTYDPRNTNGAEVAAETQVPANSLVDQKLILALRGQQLVYHSAPFETDVEVSGFFKLIAWIGIDCPDTDLYVSVHDIDLDSRSIRLTTDVIRARYREGLRTPKLIRTLEPLRYDFNRFTFTSRLIRRGHRLRLVIGPMGRTIESNFTQKNYNSGGVVAEESVKDARPVTVRLFHDEVHPSALYVPLGRAVAAAELDAPQASCIALPDATY
jgi:putative CocE/NonD family hydrolase